MTTRIGSAVWEGTLREGKGTVKLGEAGYEGPYSFASRFESGQGTNPEELIGAAHAGCFTMALAAGLSKAGLSPERIVTKAKVHLVNEDGAFRIARVELETEAKVPGVEPSAFEEQATTAKRNCPVSRALAGVDITLAAKLV
jgi:lipoyl-dependent peroxiredoxin